MKTALVIGLALTANAYKTEQTETSVHIKGNVKDWKDLQNLIPHGLKFDDQADDELFMAPRDKDGHRLPYKPGVKYDNELLIRAPQVFIDDELVWYEKTRSGLPKIHLGERPKEDLKFHVGEGFKRSGEKTRSGLPKFHFDEETDNEYVSLPKDYIEILKTHKFLLEIHDQRADDELATLPYKDYTNILKNFPKEFIGQEIKQADDEFMALPDQELYHQAPNRLRIPKEGSSRPSKQGPPKQDLPSGEFPKMILGSDNPGLYFGDDELMSRPILQQVVNDDELAFWHAPPKEFTSHPALDKLAVALRVDDEVDDELVLLKDLLKPERHRPFDGALPRDELRVAENPKLRGGLERKHHTIIIP